MRKHQTLLFIGAFLFFVCWWRWQLGGGAGVGGASRPAGLAAEVAQDTAEMLVLHHFAGPR